MWPSGTDWYGASATLAWCIGNLCLWMEVLLRGGSGLLPNPAGQCSKGGSREKVHGRQAKAGQSGMLHHEAWKQFSGTSKARAKSSQYALMCFWLLRCCSSSGTCEVLPEGLTTTCPICFDALICVQLQFHSSRLLKGIRHEQHAFPQQGS